MTDDAGATGKREEAVILHDCITVAANAHLMPRMDNAWGSRGTVSSEHLFNSTLHARFFII